MGSNITANIVLRDVNINVNHITNAVAFDTNVNNSDGVIVNLNLHGVNVLRSGSNSAGLSVPSPSSLLITASSTGSLTATGGTDGGVVLVVAVAQ